MHVRGAARSNWGNVYAPHRPYASINFNNTTELNSTIYFCRVGHNDFNYSSNPTYLENSKIRVKNRTTDAPVSMQGKSNWCARNITEMTKTNTLSNITFIADKCSTQSGESASCVGVRECRPLLQLLTNLQVFLLLSAAYFLHSPKVVAFKTCNKMA